MQVITYTDAAVEETETGPVRTHSRLARAFVVKGVLAVAFGIVLLVWPDPTVHAIVLTFGVLAILDGLHELWTAAAAPRAVRWPSVLLGATGVGFGLAVLAWPDITAEVLLALIGLWAIVKGVVEIVVAARLRATGEARVQLGVCGLLATAFGVFVLADPGAGAVAVRGLIAGLALVTGAGFITAGVGLARRKRSAMS
jgi:uncharacterized membrane protein HdeD (DUF308 family)